MLRVAIQVLAQLVFAGVDRLLVVDQAIAGQTSKEMQLIEEHKGVHFVSLVLSRTSPRFVKSRAAYILYCVSFV